MLGRRSLGAVVAASVSVALGLAGCTSRPPVPGQSVTASAAPQTCLDPPAVPTTTPAVTTSPAPGGLGGAAGIGDSYFPLAGNGGYDVTDYRLDLRFDPASGILTGAEVITATATADLARFNLDFRAPAPATAGQANPTKLTVNGAAAGQKTDGDELTVTPAKPLAKGATFTVGLSYSGKPRPYQEQGLGTVGFLVSPGGAIAVGEPQVAASWFAVNDHPRDKATYHINITAPDGLAAISNGVLTGQTRAGGSTTWSWVEDNPMASYLATVVIGNYRVASSVHNGLPVTLAVHGSLPTSIDAQLARTPDVFDFLVSKFGPYPFDAIGGVVVADQRIGFALENQTKPVYSREFFGDGDASWVLAHELAHQWFGDSVSVDDWSQIWLNEGFATYAEWLWHERNGTRSAQSTFNNLYAQNDAPMWEVPPGAPGRADLFDRSVYLRGGMTLQALRKTVGDDAFFEIIRTWATEHAGGNATTAQFVALAERISRKPLRPLLGAWLCGRERPSAP